MRGARQVRADPSHAKDRTYGGEGPILRHVHLRAGRDTLELDLCQSHLVLSLSGVRHYCKQCLVGPWRTEASVYRLDYFPSGTCSSLESYGEPASVLVIGIPTEFELMVLNEGVWPHICTATVQIADRRLKRLALTLVAAKWHSLPPEECALISVALVDRLFEAQSGKAAGRTLTRTVARVVAEYIDGHLGMRLDVSRLAQLTGLAKTQLLRAFCQTFGGPPHRYVLKRRIAVAVERLKCGVDICSLAYELGFSSHAHFSTVFRAHIGVTPSQFRRDATPKADQ